jgi:hypothetical protein
MKLTALSIALVLHGLALFGLDTTMREGTEKVAATEPVRIVITAQREDTVVAAAASDFAF